MENSSLEAPTHRLLVVHREHQLRPTWRGRRATRLQFHPAVGIHSRRDLDVLAQRPKSRVVDDDEVVAPKTCCPGRSCYDGPRA